MKGIDWIIDVLNNVRPDEFCSIDKIKELCLQAKEMENQEKKVYSEKELIDFANYLRNNNTDFWELANCNTEEISEHLNILRASEISVCLSILREPLLKLYAYA